jgi:hypothetical protein
MEQGAFVVHRKFLGKDMGRIDKHRIRFIYDYASFLLSPLSPFSKKE